MAATSITSPNIVHVTKELDPSGKLGRAANLLTQTNEMAKVVPIVRANNNTLHRTIVVTELGSAAERGMNEGTVPSISTTSQQDFQISHIDSWFKGDLEVVAASGAPEEYIGRQVMRRWEAVGQRWGYLSIYGNHASSQKQFTGLANMASMSTLGQQCISAGGSTSSVQSSMYLIDAGEDSVYYITPQNSPTYGIQTVNHGIQIAQRQNGVDDAHMAAHVRQVKLAVGLVVEDQRKAIRIANIEVSHFTALTSTQATTSMESLPHKMLIAIGRLPRDSRGNRFFLADRTVYVGLVRLAMEKSMTGLGLRDAMNQLGNVESTLYFQNIPIYLQDQITNTEAVVS